MESAQEPAPEAGGELGADQVALVTGCTGAIGRATASAFAALGHRLVLVDADGPALAQVGRLCLERSPRAHQPLELALDLSEGHQVARSVVERALAHFGRLDVLVNQAGLSARTRHDDPHCMELYHRIVATNQHASLYLSLSAYEALSKTQGSIVNVCSLLGDGGAQDLQRHRFAYCMSKAAVAMMSKCLAADFAPQVRVNCVSPGSIATTILDDMGAASSAHAGGGGGGGGGELAAAEADEVARMIVFLSAKDKAAGITGTRVLLDGSLARRRPSQLL